VEINKGKLLLTYKGKTASSEETPVEKGLKGKINNSNISELKHKVTELESELKGYRGKDRPDWQELEDINIQELEDELLDAEQELLETNFKPSQKNEALANYNPNDFRSQQDEQGNDIQPLYV